MVAGSGYGTMHMRLNRMAAVCATQGTITPIRQLPTWRTVETVKLFMHTGVTFGERLSGCGPFNLHFNRVCSDLALGVSSDPLHEGRLPRTPSAR